MKQHQLVVLGVSAALVAGMATMASAAEPRNFPNRPVERKGGISIQLHMPIFGKSVHQRSEGRDARCQPQQNRERDRNHWGRGRGNQYGHDHHNGPMQHGNGPMQHGNGPAQHGNGTMQHDNGPAQHGNGHKGR